MKKFFAKKSGGVHRLSFPLFSRLSENIPRGSFVVNASTFKHAALKSEFESSRADGDPVLHSRVQISGHSLLLSRVFIYVLQLDTQVCTSKQFAVPHSFAPPSV